MMKLVTLLCAAAVLSSAQGGAVVPLAYSAYSTPAVSYSSSVVHGGVGYASPAVYAAAPVAYATRAVSLAPNSPAVVLSPEGVPLDTPEVVAARAQHYTAKALASSGVHYLRKRSIAAAPAIAAYSAYSAPAVSYSSSVVHGGVGYAAPAVYAAAPVARAVSLAPNSPAVVLSPEGVPLDTPEVVAARAQHYTAKALASSGVHYLRKRSIVAAPAIATYSAYSAPVAATYSAYAAPVVPAYSAYSTFPTQAYSTYNVHPY